MILTVVTGLAEDPFSNCIELSQVLNHLEVNRGLCKKLVNDIGAFRQEMNLKCLKWTKHKDV